MFYFLWGRVKNSDVTDGLTPLQLNKKIQKMNRRLLVKNLGEKKKSGGFPQNSLW